MTSLSYVFDIVDDYRELTQDMDEMIEKTGYKTSFLASSLNLSHSAFYLKRKNRTFTLDEIEKLLSLIVKEDLGNAKLIKELQDIEESEQVLSQEEFNKALNL
jgi:hypothetical protein